MKKLLDTNFQNGSLQEIVSGDFFTNNGSKIKKTEKGLSTCFSDSSNYLEVPNNPDISTRDFTVYFEVKTDWKKENRVQAIYDQRDVASDGLFIYINAIGGIVFFVNSVLKIGNVELKNNEFNFVRIDFDRSGLGTIYTNGIESGSVDISGSGPIDVTNLAKFGNRCFSPGVNDLNGAIKRLVIFDGLIDDKTESELLEEFNYSFPLGETHRNFYYPKASDISNEDGLLLAWNMKYEKGGVVTDISGNGNNGNTNLAYPINDDLFFGNFGSFTRSDGALTGEYKTIAFRIESRDEITNSLGTQIFFANTNSNVPFMSFGDTTAGAFGETITLITSGGTTYITDNFPAKVTMSIVFRRNGSSYDFWINGKQYTTSFVSAHFPLLSDLSFELMYRTFLSDRQTYGILKDFKIYSRSFSDKECKDYSNEYAKEVAYINNLVYTPADGIEKKASEIEDSVGGTGTFKVLELQNDDPNSGLKKGQKYIECVSSGTLVFQNKYPYGHFKTYFMKGSTDNILQYSYLNDIGGFGNDNSYTINFNIAEAVRHIKRVNGSGSDLFQTVNGYITNNTWYGIEGILEIDQTREIKISGGTFGVVPQTIVPDGGFNPVVDGSHTENKYSLFDADSGDMLIPGCWLKGVEK